MSLIFSPCHTVFASYHQDVHLSIHFCTLLSIFTPCHLILYPANHCLTLPCPFVFCHPFFYLAIKFLREKNVHTAIQFCILPSSSHPASNFSTLPDIFLPCQPFSHLTILCFTFPSIFSTLPYIFPLCQPFLTLFWTIVSKVSQFPIFLCRELTFLYIFSLLLVDIFV